MITKQDLINNATEKPSVKLQAKIIEITRKTIDTEIEKRFLNDEFKFRIYYHEIVKIIKSKVHNYYEEINDDSNVQDALLDTSFIYQWVINGMMNYAIDSELDVTGNCSTASPYELRVSLHNVVRTMNDSHLKKNWSFRNKMSKEGKA